MDEDKLDVNEILKAPYSEYEYESKLSLAKTYIDYCNSCIDSDNLTIKDPELILLNFEDVFLAATKIVKLVDIELFKRIIDIDTKLNLSQNMIRLGMFANKKVKREYNTFLNILRRILSRYSLELVLPEVGAKQISTSLLLEIKTALVRLSGLLNTSSRVAEEWYYQNEDVLVVGDLYDPRRIPKEQLILLLNNAIKSIELEGDISSPIKDSIVNELKVAVNELSSSKTPWNKVMSRIGQTVMLLGAIIAIGDDIDGAYKNAKKAYDYVSSAMNFIATQALQPNSTNLIPAHKNLSISNRNIIKIESSEPDATNTID